MKADRTSRRKECGHWAPKRGTELPQAKLNEPIVRLMRAQHAAKEAVKRELDRQFGVLAFARRYRVSETAIAKALGYATWRHVA